MQCSCKHLYGKLKSSLLHLASTPCKENKGKPESSAQSKDEQVKSSVASESDESSESEESGDDTPYTFDHKVNNAPFVTLGLTGKISKTMQLIGNKKRQGILTLLGNYLALEHPEVQGKTLKLLDDKEKFPWHKLQTLSSSMGT